MTLFASCKYSGGVGVGKYGYAGAGGDSITCEIRRNSSIVFRGTVSGGMSEAFGVDDTVWPCSECGEYSYRVYTKNSDLVGNRDLEKDACLTGQKVITYWDYMTCVSCGIRNRCVDDDFGREIVLPGKGGRNGEVKRYRIR